MTGAAQHSGYRLDGRRLYLCTGDRADLAQFLEHCIAGGVDVVQLREKRADARHVLARARLAQRVCHAAGVPFILNDRPDLALELGADGVHLGQDDAPVSLARRMLGPQAIIGLSTHAPHELDAALVEAADYLSVGPVVETPTKPGRPGTGLDYVALAARRAHVPWFVTGGIGPQQIAELARSGARRFVVVRFLTEAPDPREAARVLRARIDEVWDATAAPGETWPTAAAPGDT